MPQSLIGTAGLRAEALDVRVSLGLAWQHAASRPRRAASRALSRDSSFENLRVSQVRPMSWIGCLVCCCCCC